MKYKWMLISLLLVTFLILVTGCETVGLSRNAGSTTKEIKTTAKSSDTEFAYVAPDAKSVSLVGEFNNWDANANPMQNENGTWKLTLPLAPGTYQYKFYVNGADWKPDPNNQKTVDDGYGGKNSVITVGESAVATTEVAKQPVTNEKNTKQSATNKKNTKQPVTNEKNTKQSTTSAENGVKFVYKDANAKTVFLVGEFNNWSTTANPMTNNKGTWTTTLNIPQGKYQYKFLVNGTDWKTDPNNSNSADDGYGGKNSVVTIGQQTNEVKETVKQTSNVEKVTKQSASTTENGVKFTYEDPSAKDVFLVGEFNNWNTTANPMTNDKGVWSTTLNIPQGKYQYKFLVNGTDWKTDPNNSNSADDGYGGKNSVIEVGNKTQGTRIIVPQTAQKIQEINKPASSDTFPVKFEYKPLTGGSHSVFLAGDFNSWSTSATPMIEKNGNYEVTLNLKKGKYGYKFVVDGNWVTDDNAKDFADDGYGGQNSIAFVGLASDISSLRKVIFTYNPKGNEKSVYLVGSFNNWNQTATRMDKQADGTYQTTLLLKPDTYQYKFIINGTDWTTDMNAKSLVDDGFGGKNSVVEVDESFPKVTIAPGDGNILTYGISTEQSLENINPLSENQIEFKTKAHMNDVENVSVKINGQIYPMKMVGDDGSFTYYRYVYNLQKKDEPLSYRYVYKDGSSIYSLWNGGFTNDDNTNKSTSSIMPIDFRYPSNAIQPFYTPDWAKNGIIYQIFPDRFANGDKANDPDFKEWYYQGINIPPKPGTLLPSFQPYYHLVKDWYDISGLTKSPYHQGNQPDYNSFYGGDITGVDQNLNYLKDLGITIIYFNPINQAKSNHRYDAEDYKTIDPHFGTETEFQKFVQDAHALGIKVILDVAYNHTGETHWAFQDGMKKGHSSPYYNWYEWKKWPMPNPLPAGDKPSNYYDCWWGFGEMPDLNYDLIHSNSEENSFKDTTNVQPNTPVVDYVVSTADYWIGKLDIDGFRLDVPNEVPFWFWERFRARVKSIKPDAYLVGEIWTNASDWVNNKYFDSVMNYAYFRDPVQRFIIDRRTTAKKFDQELKPGVMNYPIQASEVMMNLIDSHDTYRFLESAKGDVSKLKLAAFFQMTWMGIPHIWYGDEIGMMGAKDPDCRRPFNWHYTQDANDVALHDYYKKLIAIRKAHPALRTGTITPLVTDGMTYGYLRTLDNENVIVVLNNDTKDASVTIPVTLPDGNWKDELSSAQYTLKSGKMTVPVSAMGGVILVQSGTMAPEKKQTSDVPVKKETTPIEKKVQAEPKQKVTSTPVQSVVPVKTSGDNSYTVYFASGSATLNAEGIKTLNDVLARVKDMDAPYKIQLAGHTDKNPITGNLAKKYKTNWDLSVARCLSVADYLISKGKIEPTDIIFTGKGETVPNGEQVKTGSMINPRRVEVEIIPQ